MKKDRESTKPESPQTAKMFSFLSFSPSSSSDRLVQNCVFHNGFHTKWHYLTLSSVPAHCFLTTLKTHEVFFEAVTEEPWLHLHRHFLHLYLCAQIIVAMKLNYYSSLLNQEYTQYH